jgi:S1-C subfamily serine protease
MTQMPHDPYIVEADKDSMHLFGSPNFDSTPQNSAILGVISEISSADSRVGVLISGVRPGTPAYAIGLRQGDLLVQFGSEKLENTTDLVEALTHSKPGDHVTIKIIRGSQSLSFEVTLAERKS